jgi:hypothetical protein
MKKLLTLLLFVFSALYADAQEMLGISNSNYAGITGAALNPSLMVHSRMKWDLNLIGADIFVQNNYVYIPRIYSTQQNTSDTISDTYEFLKDYYTPNPLKNVYMSVALKLPSLMFRIRRHTLAIHTGYRTALSVRDLDYRTAKFAYEETHLNFTPLHNTFINASGFKIAGMAWAEIGLSYGYPVIRREKWLLDAAFTVKRAFANAGVYINSNRFIYQITPNANGTDEDMIVRGIDMEYGHSLQNSDALFTGGGFGFDFGFTFIKRRNPGGFVKYSQRGRVDKYDYKIGASVMDFGSINFSENARRSVLVNPFGGTWQYVNTVSLKDLEVFDNEASTQIYGNALASFAGSDFTVGLPTAASVQMDFNINDKMYLNTTFIQSTPLMTPSIIRPSQASVALRYETKYFEVGVPYSLYEYKDHRIGVGFRFGPFIVGTDKLGSFLGLNDFTGMDFYFAIKVGSYIENEAGQNPNNCFYKRIFRKFQRKRSAPKSPAVKF